MTGLPLYTHDDFIRAYYNALPHHKRYEDAYWYVEDMYKAKYGGNKYVVTLCSVLRSADG
jgi:hypothetical protein